MTTCSDAAILYRSTLVIKSSIYRKQPPPSWCAARTLPSASGKPAWRQLGYSSMRHTVESAFNVLFFIHDSDSLPLPLGTSWFPLLRNCQCHVCDPKVVTRRRRRLKKLHVITVESLNMILVTLFSESAPITSSSEGFVYTICPKYIISWSSEDSHCDDCLLPLLRVSELDIAFMLSISV